MALQFGCQADFFSFPNCRRYCYPKRNTSGDDSGVSELFHHLLLQTVHNGFWYHVLFAVVRVADT